MGIAHGVFLLVENGKLKMESEWVFSQNKIQAYKINVYMVGEGLAPPVYFAILPSFSYENATSLRREALSNIYIKKTGG